MCPFFSSPALFFDGFFFFAIKVFLLSWIIFVPIAITSRLEKMIKLLEEIKNQKP